MALLHVLPGRDPVRLGLCSDLLVDNMCYRRLVDLFEEIEGLGPRSILRSVANPAAPLGPGEEEVPPDQDGGDAEDYTDDHQREHAHMVACRSVCGVPNATEAVTARSLIAP